MKDKDLLLGGPMKFIYPAIIHDDADGFWAEFPDLAYTSSTGATRTDTTYPTLVQTDIDLAKNSKSVKKTLTIPAWLNDRALAKGINFSQLLQEALVEKTM